MSALFYFRALLEIYTAAYKQDNFAVVDKVIKQFNKQVVVSTDKSVLLFCQSLHHLQGFQTAIDKMTRRKLSRYLGRAPKSS